MLSHFFPNQTVKTHPKQHNRLSKTSEWATTKKMLPEAAILD
jgi:hypothetical protein